MTNAREEYHAREENDRASPQRRSEGQSAEHAGRRVRARGGAPRSRGQARCTLDQTGDSDRIVEGPPGRREAAPAEERSGLRKDAPERGARISRRPEQPEEETLGEALSRDQRSAEARESGS